MGHASAVAVQSPHFQRKSFLHSSLLPASLQFPNKRISRLSVRAEAEDNPTVEKTESTSVSDSSGQSSGKALGFGSSSTSSSRKESGNKKKSRERASVIRRNPVEKPASLSSRGGDSQAEQQTANENAFLLTWLGLGILILVEGIALAASGFLPEEWDKFFVKYLYPSFTPTVFLFVGGSVVYGVIKYLQGEQGKT